MMDMRYFLLTLLFFSLNSYAQEPALRMIELQGEIEEKEAEISVLRSEIEDIKLGGMIKDLKNSGLPSAEYAVHSGMILAFSEETGQAAWVAHIISPDIVNGNVARTNDFRDDPLIEGEAVEADYFLKELQADSTYRYDGFGYDRGHLAPSADFSWSRKALSESYFYSNMSPQHPDFNRESWAELEGTLRGYVIRNEVPLYVITMPVVDEGFSRVERGVNQLPIPQRFIKAVFDPQNGKAVAFVMDNSPTEGDNADFAVSVDRVEEISGMDLFSSLDDGLDRVEAFFDIADWYPESSSDGVTPIYAPPLPQGHINTTQAQRWMGSQKKVHVCGTVVSSRFSGSGNYWLNLDKKFPNTVFNVYVRKKDFVNFDGIDQEYLMNEKVCFYGKVTSMYGLPNMNILRQEQVTKLD